MGVRYRYYYLSLSVPCIRILWTSDHSLYVQLVWFFLYFNFDYSQSFIFMNRDKTFLNKISTSSLWKNLQLLRRNFLSINSILFPLLLRNWSFFPTPLPRIVYGSRTPLFVTSQTPLFLVMSHTVPRTMLYSDLLYRCNPKESNRVLVTLR